MSNKGQRKIFIAYLFGGVAIVMAIMAVVFYVYGSDEGRILAAISTVASISMSISTLYYSRKTGAKTSETLKKIEEQNDEFIDHVKQALIEGSYMKPNKNEKPSKKTGVKI